MTKSQSFYLFLKSLISGAKSPIHSASGSMLPTTNCSFLRKHLNKQVIPQLDQWHRATECTWMYSSSSMCLRALYKNMPRLLHASPGQTTVTTALPEHWIISNKSLYFSRPVFLRRNFHMGLKVYSDAVAIQIGPELKAEWSVRSCSLQTPSTVNM